MLKYSVSVNRSGMSGSVCETMEDAIRAAASELIEKFSAHDVQIEIEEWDSEGEEYLDTAKIFEIPYENFSSIGRNEAEAYVRKIVEAGK